MTKNVTTIGNLDFLLKRRRSKKKYKSTIIKIARSVFYTGIELLRKESGERRNVVIPLCFELI